MISDVLIPVMDGYELVLEIVDPALSGDRNMELASEKNIDHLLRVSRATTDNEAACASLGTILAPSPSDQRARLSGSSA